MEVKEKVKNKEYLSLLTLIPLILILVSALSTDGTFFVFAAGAADAYGDEISECSVWQGATMKGNITYSNYTSGVQVKVDALTATQFNCSVLLNNTFASSAGEAIDNTRVYINITYSNGTVVISTTEMTDYKAVDNGDGTYTVYSYYLWDDATHHPIAGVTYYVWLNYEVYR